MTDRRLYPTFRYRDPDAVLRWLIDTLGFVEVAVYRDGARLAHAELAWGRDIVMIGTVQDDAFGAVAGAPDPAVQGGKCLYLSTPDVDALHARVAASGVEVVQPPEEKSYGAREFLCRDPEGNLWSFGGYAPQPDR